MFRRKRPQDWEQTSDAELLEHYRKGAEPAFAELVRRYETELYNYLRRYLGNPILAEDVFQCTFMQLHLKVELYQAGRPVRPWLYTIATNQAIDALRKARRHESISLDARPGHQEQEGNTFGDLVEGVEEDPLARLERDERRDWVKSTLQALPDHLRSVVVMAYYQGLKYREIAEVLEIPVGTVKSRLHAAVAKLGKAWEMTRNEAGELYHV